MLRGCGWYSDAHDASIKPPAKTTNKLKNFPDFIDFFIIRPPHRFNEYNSKLILFLNFSNRLVYSLIRFFLTYFTTFCAKLYSVTTKPSGFMKELVMSLPHSRLEARTEAFHLWRLTAPVAGA